MASIFQTKKINEPTLGEYLKKGRQKCGLTIEKIAEELSVSDKHLLALEEEDYLNLPPEVYVVGLLRRYSRILNLDEEKSIFLFKKKKIQRNYPLYLHPLIKHRLISKLFTYKNFVIFLVFGLTCVLIFYLIKVLHPLYTKPDFFLEIPSGCEKGAIVENSEMIEIKGKIQPEGRIFINDEEIISDKDGGFATRVFLKEGENPIEFRVINKFGRERKDRCVVKK